MIEAWKDANGVTGTVLNARRPLSNHRPQVGLGAAPADFYRAIDMAFPTWRDPKPPEDGPTHSTNLENKTTTKTKAMITVSTGVAIPSLR